MDRSSNAKQVVDVFIRQRSSGAACSEKELISAHPELSPDLERQLRFLRLIDGARTRAETVTEAESSGADRSPKPSRTRPLPEFPGFELTGEVHRGGQGVVYRALQQSTGRCVAIKVMRQGAFAGPRDKARFEREVHILGQLNHANIVTIHDSGVVDQYTYFVMDYVDGRPLDEFVAAGKLNVRAILELFEKTCRAVNAAHLQGVIHRDLKPSNIRVNPEGEPQILDFGLAKVTAGGEDWGGDAALHTLTGQFVGSLPWASPEQVDGRAANIDIRTDVYSLGVILFQLLTGRFPYDVTGSVREVMDRISNEEPNRMDARPSMVNDEIRTIALKCLSKEPDRRYQSAGELARDVRRYLDGEPIEAKRDSSWYVLKKTVRRYRVPTAVGAIFLVLAVSLTIALLVMDHREAELVVIRAELEAHRASKDAEQSRLMVRLVEELFAASADAVGGQLTVRGALDQNAKRLSERLENQPLLQARFTEMIANKYSELGAYGEAAHWQRKVLAIHRDELQSDERTLSLRHRSLGALLSRAGEHVEADLHYRKARELLERITNGPDHDLAALLLYRAGLMHVRGDNAAARARAMEGLDMTRALHSGDHPHVVEGLSTVSWVLHDISEFELAEAYLREFMAMAERLNPNASFTRGRHELALLLKDTGRYAAAEEMLLKLHDEALQRADGLSQRLADSHLSLAKLYIDKAEPRKAEPYCRAALDLHDQIYGGESRFTARPMTLLARILVRQRRFAEAEPLARRAVEIREKRMPPQNWKLAKSRSVLGAALVGLGRLKEPEPLLLAGYEIITDNRGPQHRRTYEALQRLISFHDAANNPEKAAEFRAKLPQPYWIGRD